MTQDQERETECVKERYQETEREKNKVCQNEKYTARVYVCDTEKRRDSKCER